MTVLAVRAEYLWQATVPGLETWQEWRAGNTSIPLMSLPRVWQENGESMSETYGGSFVQ